LVEFKLPTPINYGQVDTHSRAVMLTLFGAVYQLKSVVCHLGSAESGHYIAYVWRDDAWWHYDDTAHNGKMVAGGASFDTHVKQAGELYFYDLCV
jgi:ubiquitin C-terminal hydrolase